MASSTMDIDDSLYSRQRYMLGDQAMQKMASSRVLLFGCDGLGIEIAKNLVLTGVKVLRIADSKITSLVDAEQNFFISNADVEKKNRAEACVARLSELNPYVSVDVCDADVHLKNAVEGNEESHRSLTEYIASSDCIVATQCDIKSQIFLNEICRSSENPVRFVGCNVYGLFSSLFCDFGEKFEVFDPTGEEPNEVLIEDITQGNPGIVTCMEFRLHGLQDGDHVTFKDVKGMTELNGQVMPVKVITPQTFSIGDTTNMPEYETSGLVKQVKIPVTVKHESLAVQLEKPDLLLADLGKMFNPPILHAGFRALDNFFEMKKTLPRPWNGDDAKEVWALFLSLAKDSSLDIPVESSTEHLIQLLACTCNGVLPPMAATVGGLAAHETLKSLTGKYTPLKQWLYLDASELLEVLPEKISDDLIGLHACLPQDVISFLSEMQVFMIGCGAIGCEMLKNLALLGVATNEEKGKIVVTDYDIIEKSNLNRQFLFRSHHIRQHKSKVAVEAVKDINSNINLESLQSKVCPETETQVFTDQFFKKQDIVVNALDNVQARRYVDSRCVTNQKSLVESGTMGPKGHVQIVYPFVTESYSSQHDPADHEVPYCTLKSFPSQIEHTIQWARDKFERLFTQKPTLFNKFWHEAGAKQQTDGVNVVKSVLDRLVSGEQMKNAHLSVKMLTHHPSNWPDCVSFARCMFEKFFNHKAQQLLHAFPMDTKMQDGSPFWSSPKRPPHPVDFNINDPLHFQFIVSSASLLANIYHIEPPEANETKRKNIELILQGVKVPAFVPSDKPIEIDERAAKTEEPPDDLDGDDVKLKGNLQVFLNNAKEPLGLTLCAEEFEKDDDTNHHIDFITAASNLRAIMYGIDTVDRLETKRIAGNIIPAISTTTAAVAGLATIQFLQVAIQLMKKNDMETDIDEAEVYEKLSKFRNSFLNLALPLVVMSEPAAAQRIPITKNLSYCLWDRWEVRGHKDYKLKDFIQHFKSKINLDVSMVMQGAKMVYVPVMPGHSKRLNQPMQKLIKTGASNPSYVDLIIGFTNDSPTEDDADDLSCPPVRYYLGI